MGIFGIGEKKPKDLRDTKDFELEKKMKMQQMKVRAATVNLAKYLILHPETQEEKSQLQELQDISDRIKAHANATFPWDKVNEQYIREQKMLAEDMRNAYNRWFEAYKPPKERSDYIAMSMIVNEISIEQLEHILERDPPEVREERRALMMKQVGADPAIMERYKQYKEQGVI